MKIKINKIFRKYDITYDCEKRCCIYVGENGIGKSTILKILNCIKNLNFVEIVKYDFESIEFTFDNETFTVIYEDFLLSYDEMLKKYELDNCGAIEEKVEEKTNKSTNDFDIFNISYRTYVFLKNIKNYYPYIVKHCLNEVTLEKNIEKILSDIFDNLFDIGNDPISYIDLLLDIKKRLLDTNIVNHYISNNAWFCCQKPKPYPIENQKYKKFSYYNFTEFSKMKDLHLKLKEFTNSSFYINMAGEYNIENSLSDNVIENILETSLVNENFSEYDISSTSMENKKYIFELLKDTYKKNLVINEKTIENIIETKKINIADILFNKSISNDILDEFVELYYSLIKIYRFNEKDFNDYEFDEYGYYKNSNVEYDFDEYNFILINYISPLLPQKAFYYNNYMMGKQLKINKNFKDKLYNKIIDNLKPLNSLLDKYITNKKVIATPNGIVVSLDKNKLHNDLTFEHLSAGEKKLVIIFILCTCFDNIDFCLDEPENSLSVVWQKNIINDILQNSNNSSITVATQSPYIVSDDNLEESVIYLPIENENE